jgi:hypothetical protein
MYESQPPKTMAVKNPFTFRPGIAISNGRSRLKPAQGALPI